MSRDDDVVEELERRNISNNGTRGAMARLAVLSVVCSDQCLSLHTAKLLLDILA